MPASDGLLKTITVIILVVAALVLGRTAMAAENQCLACHIDAAKLQAAISQLPQSSAPKALWGTDPVEPMSRVERVLIDEAFFDQSCVYSKKQDHSDVACHECHQGDPAAVDYEAAHAGVVKDPSYPSPGVCGECHTEEAKTLESSLHYTLKGMRAPVGLRFGTGNVLPTKIEAAFESNCSVCHASCGQCHVSRPEAVGGGLTKGHRSWIGSVENNCLACHGRTVAAEWKGNGKNLLPDVHYGDFQMYCDQCHTSKQIHGDGHDYASRYQVANGPACVDCHAVIFTDQGENKEVHSLHKGRLSCQVCHAQPYNNCNECHLDSNSPVFDAAKKTWTAFKIGLNPAPDEAHPEKFVTVRRIPADPMAFVSFDQTPPKDFKSLPTYAMATPHNVRRSTPQNKECNNCHGNWEWFLMLSDVPREEQEANRAVIVPPKKVPAKVATTSE